jgi:hypothetical protein
MADYRNGKLYKMYVSDFENLCYIGSTTNKLAQRLGQHKSAAKCEGQKKCASSILFRENDRVVIELLELFPCETKHQLNERERHWIEQFPECLNKNIPGQTWQERWEKNREHNVAKHKEWAATHKEHIREYDAGRRHIDNARANELYAAGYKEKRAEAKKVRVICDVCQKEMNKNSLWTHKNTAHKAD